MSPAFKRYIGIDYSGAETPTSSLNGLRVYEADAEIIAQEVQPRRARANTGRAGASLSGWSRIWLADRQLSSESTTGSHFLCATLSVMACRSTGHSFSTTSSDIGRPTKTTHTSNSFGMEVAEMLPPVLGIRAGVESRNCERAVPSQCFSSMSRDRSPNPLTLAYRGCDISGSTSVVAFIFGRSTGGVCHLILR